MEVVEFCYRNKLSAELINHGKTAREKHVQLKTSHVEEMSIN
jgi:hypothetical protein